MVAALFNMQNYRYETPTWAVRLLLLLSFSVSAGGFILFYNFEVIGNGESTFLKWFLLFFSTVFLLVILQPRNWKRWIYFYADNEGLHFPSDCPSTNKTTWLTVSWKSVGEIRKETFLNRRKGVLIEVQLSQDNIEKYFRDIKFTHELLGVNHSRGKYFCVGYSNAFNHPDKAVSILNIFKSAFT